MMATCANCQIEASDVPSRDGPGTIILCALHEAAPQMVAALRLCLKATEGYVGPGHVEAYNAVRHALEDATDEEREDTPKTMPEAVAFAHLSGAAPALQSKLRGSLSMMAALRLILAGAPGWTAEAESHLLAFMGEVRAALASAGGMP